MRAVDRLCGVLEVGVLAAGVPSIGLCSANFISFPTMTVSLNLINTRDRSSVGMFFKLYLEHGLLSMGSPIKIRCFFVGNRSI